MQSDQPCRSVIMSEPWISVEPITEYLRITHDSICRWIGRLWKFQLSEVDEWVRAGGANERKEQE
jgi:hypothetical protein